MLIDICDIASKRSKKKEEYYPYDTLFPSHIDFVGEPWTILSKHIGKLETESIVNFWTFGRYAMCEVLTYILRQVGPSSVQACTWAISKDSALDLVHLHKIGLITDFKLWIDPRVRVRNPEPLAILRANFPIVINPVHAKVCTIGNENWKISLSGSLNFTSNPQPERGIIQCVESVYNKDKEIIENEFRK
jgi:hypothetical protein